MRWILLCCLAGLAACDQVKARYGGATIAGQSVAPAKLQELAKDGYEYVALSKTMLVVRPRDLLEPDTAPPQGTPDAPKGQQKVPPRTSSQDAPADTSSTPSSIGRHMWVAVPTPIADYGRSFLVHGIVGFWSSTTLAISRYPNSDRVASVASTAVNLVPKRIEQVTTLAGTLIQLSAAAVSTEDDELRPFAVELPKESVTKQVSVQRGWGYTVEYPNGEERPGTVSFAKDFGSLFENGEVNYWPVQACRVAKLTLFHDHRQYVFFATVADPDRIRLQPLPVAGKIELGTVCGASVSGVTSSDPLAAVVDDVTALQQAAQKLSLAPAASPARPASGAPAKQ